MGFDGDGGAVMVAAVVVWGCMAQGMDHPCAPSPWPPQVKPGGVAVLVSPYSWLAAWTPKDKWVGGYYGKVRLRAWPMSLEPAPYGPLARQRKCYAQGHAARMCLVSPLCWLGMRACALGAAAGVGHAGAHACRLGGQACSTAVPPTPARAHGCVQDSSAVRSADAMAQEMGARGFTLVHQVGGWARLMGRAVPAVRRGALTLAFARTRRRTCRSSSASMRASSSGACRRPRCGAGRAAEAAARRARWTADMRRVQTAFH